MTSTTAVDRRPRFPLLKKSAAILFWIAVWEIVSLCVGQELLVPSPAQVLVRLLQLLRETDFWLISAASLLRVVGRGDRHAAGHTALYRAAGFRQGVFLPDFPGAQADRKDLRLCLSGSKER